MISDFFTTDIQVSRQVWTGEISTNSIKGTFKGNIQQSTPEIAVSYNTAFNRTYIVFLPLDTDVKIGDILTANGVDYFVKGLLKSDMGNIQHLQLICEMPEL